MSFINFPMLGNEFNPFCSWLVTLTVKYLAKSILSFGVFHYTMVWRVMNLHYWLMMDIIHSLAACKISKQQYCFAYFVQTLPSQMKNRIHFLSNRLLDVKHKATIQSTLSPSHSYFWSLLYPPPLYLSLS